jgi:hypothetical protein
MDSRKNRKRMPQVFGQGRSGNPIMDISYRNQNEIMRKIFGNEQSYH